MSDYIKLFNTKAEQDRFLSSSGYKEPHISCTANGGNLRYNQSFVGILVGTNGSLRAYIKSTQLDAFISKRAVRAYSDATCTELIEGSLTFESTITGIDEYYESLGDDAYEVPELNEIYVEDGIITTYLEEQKPTEEPGEVLTYQIIGHLSTDSSKKAYISIEDESNLYGDDPTIYVYSDGELEEPAVNGHYIGDHPVVLSFDVTNGLISNIEKNIEEVTEEECEIYFFKIVKDDDTIPTPSKITYVYDDEYTIQLDQQFSADSCSGLLIKVYFNNVLTINKSIAVTDHKLITIVRSGSGYDLVTSEYTPEEEEPEEPLPEEPDEPVEFLLRPIGSHVSSDYFAWASSYDINEGDEVYADDSGEEYAVDGEYVWYSEEEPWDPPIYGTTGFLVDGGLVTGFVYDMLLGYLSTDQSQKAYINTNQVGIGIPVYSDNTYLVSAVDGHYICVTGDVISFDVTNGLISDIEQLEEEEPEEESGVMPADGMDPDAGGGEDIVEEEPTDSPEEEVEEEP